ncbi:hypothetical protein WN72_33315 [Bradyrhizobium arachidis]|uniref:Uncharacterized protein n=1 Tax=Bradyrhizobium arachidis TaxID=858423 RepID=A0AAE7TJ43_9BRAD|nr:hypothetical protein WN72_33315 [Bradyrhizobium arachidis]
MSGFIAAFGSSSTSCFGAGDVLITFNTQHVPFLDHPYAILFILLGLEYHIHFYTRAHDDRMPTLKHIA